MHTVWLSWYIERMVEISKLATVSWTSMYRLMGIGLKLIAQTSRALELTWESSMCITTIFGTVFRFITWCVFRVNHTCASSTERLSNSSRPATSLIQCVWLVTSFSALVHRVEDLPAIYKRQASCRGTPYGVNLQKTCLLISLNGNINLD